MNQDSSTPPPVTMVTTSANSAEARITELEAALGEAERALEPFAKRAGKLDGIWKDHETQWSPEYGDTAITIGHLRAASRTITKIKETRNAE